ncbi:MAG: TATA-box-binding protein [Desulfurococcaceae archaeon]|jgi:transcription initiation factor TFIID TATA-box-binding protein|nr:TATA-box-binding protein [Desulfurococcaceae archaeon]
MSGITPLIRVENIVATVTLDQGLDLGAIARSIPNVEYDPEEFPGLVLRLDNPKLTALVFSTGKMVITGAKSTQMLIKGFKRILRLFYKHGILITGKPRVQIQNVVASANLNAEVNLEIAAEQLDNVMYEPEQFPGLIYKMNDPKVVLLIFSSGKMVITGAKSEEEVAQAVRNIYEKLKSIGALREIVVEELESEEVF